MKNSSRKFSPEFRFKVVLEALKERESLAQLAIRFEVHPEMISEWKRDFLENPAKFLEGVDSKGMEKEGPKDLKAKLERLELENNFLKESLKKIGL
jgi:transposase-like protein